MKELGSRNSSQRLVRIQRRLGYNVISEFQNYRKQTAGYKISLHKITHPHCNKYGSHDSERVIFTTLNI